MARTPHVKTSNNNFLSFKDRIRLVEWFKTHQTEIITRRLNRADVAAMASNDLQCLISSNNLASVAADSPDSPIPFKWPSGNGGRTSKAQTSEGLLLVTRCVRSIAIALGENSIQPDTIADLDDLIAALTTP